MLDSLLSIDRTLLLDAITLVPPGYARILEFTGESVVLWIAILLLCLWFYGRNKGKDEYKLIAMSIFSTIILTFIVYSIINLGLPQWRPGAMELTGARALIPHPIDNSFPSGHALFTGAALVAIFRFFPKRSLIIVTVILGLITALSRVLGGVHYPLDILGGWIIGGLGGFLFFYVVRHRFFQEYIFTRVLLIARYLKL